MASKVAIGIRRETAMNRLKEQMERLFGEEFILPTQGRDHELMHAIQLEYIANHLEKQDMELAVVAQAPAPKATRGKRGKRANANH